MTKIKKATYKNLLDKVSNLIEEARRKTVRHINTVITQTYWEIGRLIVEEEQRGEKRAEYGEYLIRRLAKDLTKQFGKGFTERNLWWMKQFYITYPKLYAMRAEFEKDEKLYALRTQLSWTHFRILMRIKDETARQFYEIETIKNNWSTRELERQIDSLLFERLTLSKNKNKVMELSRKGTFKNFCWSLVKVSPLWPGRKGLLLIMNITILTLYFITGY